MYSLLLPGLYRWGPEFSKFQTGIDRHSIVSFIHSIMAKSAKMTPKKFLQKYKCWVQKMQHLKRCYEKKFKTKMYANFEFFGFSTFSQCFLPFNFFGRDIFSNLFQRIWDQNKILLCMIPRGCFYSEK